MKTKKDKLVKPLEDWELHNKIWTKVIKRGGKYQFKTEFSEGYPIRSIKAIHYTEDFTDEDFDRDTDGELWNAYIDRKKEALGITMWFYEHAVDKNDNPIGLFACFSNDGQVVKIKHFNQWEELLKLIK